MKILILIITIFLSHQFLIGQITKRDSLISKNNYCLELGGAGIVGSLNYERLILIKTNKKLLFRVGLSIPISEYSLKTPRIPLGLYYLIGLKESLHHFELGFNNTIGYTFDNSVLNYEEKKFNYYIIPSIGYRFENFYNKSLNFSFAYSPVLFFYKREPNTIYVQKNGIFNQKIIFNGSNEVLAFVNRLKISIGYTF
jgi:hypothetical protein